MAKGKIKPDEQCRLAHVGVRLTAEEKARYDRLARQEGVTVSDLARRGLAVIEGKHVEQAERVSEGA